MAVLLRPSLQSMAVKVPLSMPVLKMAAPAAPTWVDLFGRLSPVGYNVAASIASGKLVSATAAVPVLKPAPVLKMPASKPPILELELTAEPKKILTTALSQGPGLVLLVGLAVLLLWAAIPLAKGALRRAGK